MNNPISIRRCKVCPAGSKRPAPHPGPRCSTHHREALRSRRSNAHGRMVTRTYGIGPNAYMAILAAQNGTCAICQRATGATKRLAVDHDHTCCPGKTSCGKCVRAIICQPCNVGVLGHLRDDVEALKRAIAVIQDRPAQAVIMGLDE
ncbi:endonuclease VII domain-containing protein [Rhodococcus sp. NPDC058532]|uniref:endonuclease VII domain-containing protein n=1 Tax=Rhodococcus sp. NPDC058532 TaxID=3346540 RepID=UPI0036680EBC